MKVETIFEPNLQNPQFRAKAGMNLKEYSHFQLALLDMYEIFFDAYLMRVKLDQHVPIVAAGFCHNERVHVKM